MEIAEIIELNNHPITTESYQQKCRQILDAKGLLVLISFISEQAVEMIRQEAEAKKQLAYYTTSDHNVYISDSDPAYQDTHIRNALVVSSKGCITDDQIEKSSPLRLLYDNEDFRNFLAAVLGEKTLYPYADDYSSINLHYASEGQELGWHFDNSSFATTLLIQEPEAGGNFEYIREMRNAEQGDMNFEGVTEVLAGNIEPNKLLIKPGDLTLFRGRDAIHRVTPTEGSITRLLAVLAYNNEPGIKLSASARKTFYGK